VALFIYVQPVIAATLSAVLFGERPAPRVLAGALLIFTGVFLALRR
jgi:drug/metabolite transporter (DMT)-like permease